MRSDPLIIGLVGQAKHGKSTVADLLLTSAIPEATIADEYSFAHELKRICASLFDVSPEYFREQELKGLPIPHLGISSRQLMQEVGTKMREIYPHVWTQYLMHTIDADMEDWHSDIAIVSDVRYLEEAEALRERGAYLVRVLRLNPDGSKFQGLDPNLADHASETEQLQIPEEWLFGTITAKSGDMVGLQNETIRIYERIQIDDSRTSNREST